MTKRQHAILQAINAGATSVRAIATAAGISSTSVVSSNLQALEADGHIVMERTPKGEQVYSGVDYCQAWNAAARLAGNPDA
jgi:SOS-response transcriptional repressor LexA